MAVHPTVTARWSLTAQKRRPDRPHHRFFTPDEAAGHAYPILAKQDAIASCGRRTCSKVLSSTD
jgi:hypothetical protein